jgi:hypothetical protein
MTLSFTEISVFFWPRIFEETSSGNKTYRLLFFPMADRTSRLCKGEVLLKMTNSKKRLKIGNVTTRDRLRKNREKFITGPDLFLGFDC